MATHDAKTVDASGKAVRDEQFTSICRMHDNQNCGNEGISVLNVSSIPLLVRLSPSLVTLISSCSHIILEGMPFQ